MAGPVSPGQVFPMIYALIAIAAVLLVVVLVYLRHVNRRQVASLFRSMVRDFRAEGLDMEQALRQTTGHFVRRPPFHLLKPEELTLFVHVLQDLRTPVDVGAEVLQQCEFKHSVMELKEAKKLTRLLYATDLKLSLQELIQDAKLLHGNAADRYPNIAIALLASLSAREGWTFIEEQPDVLIFDYRKERVHLPGQASGKDAARLILFKELAQRPMQVHPETDKAREAARKEIIDGFAPLFDQAFLGLGGTR